MNKYKIAGLGLMLGASLALTSFSSKAADLVTMKGINGYTNKDYASVSLSFQNEVKGLGLSSFSLTNGEISDITGSGRSYNIKLSDMGEGATKLTLKSGLKDEAGNSIPQTSCDFVVDTEKPELTLSVNKSMDLKAGEEVEFTVKVNEPVKKGSVTLKLTGANSASIPLEGLDEKEYTLGSSKGIYATSFKGRYIVKEGNGEAKITISAIDLGSNQTNAEPRGEDKLAIGSNIIRVYPEVNYAGTKLELEFSEPITKFDISKLKIDGYTAKGTVSSNTEKDKYYIMLSSPIRGEVEIRGEEGLGINKYGLKTRLFEEDVELASESSVKYITSAMESFKRRALAIEDGYSIEKLAKDIKEFEAEHKSDFASEHYDLIEEVADELAGAYNKLLAEKFDLDDEEGTLEVTASRDAIKDIIDARSNVTAVYTTAKVTGKKIEIEYKIDATDKKGVKITLDKEAWDAVRSGSVKFIIADNDTELVFTGSPISTSKTGEYEIRFKLEDENNDGGRTDLEQITKSYYIETFYYDEKYSQTQITANVSGGMMIRIPNFSSANASDFKGVCVTDYLKNTQENVTITAKDGFITMPVIKAKKYYMLSVVKEAAVTEKVEFTDMDKHWAKTYVDTLVAKGITKGITPTTFGPAKGVTRAEAAAFIVRAMKLEKQKYGRRFTDISSDKWFADDVETAAKLGVLNGYKDKTFKPQGQITKQEMVSMIIRAYIYESGKTYADLKSTHKFKDQANISSWALESVAAAKNLGIISGDKQNNFYPTKAVTRAEVAKMLVEYTKKVDAIKK